MKNNFCHFKLLSVIVISLLHVFLSANTADNGMNPITIVGLLGYSMHAIIITGYSVQFFVTLIAAWKLLKWKSFYLWFITYVIGILIIHLFDYDKFYSMLHMEGSTIEEYFYNFYGYGDALELFLYYASLQLMVCLIYPTLQVTTSFLLKSWNFKRTR